MVRVRVRVATPETEPESSSFSPPSARRGRRVEASIITNGKYGIASRKGKAARAATGGFTAVGPRSRTAVTPAKRT
ncbi:hypothetical protein GCM10009095_01590 [Sphingomonas molluscorum]|nr:hypothetical protein GCM10017606_12030 [Microbacterium terregens]